MSCQCELGVRCMNWFVCLSLIWLVYCCCWFSQTPEGHDHVEGHANDLASHGTQHAQWEEDLLDLMLLDDDDDDDDDNDDEAAAFMYST